MRHLSRDGRLGLRHRQAFTRLFLQCRSYVNSEAHGMDVSEPLVADSSFAVTMNMDVTMKGGQRMSMNELCIYHVKDGKIVSEQFFM